MPRQRIRVLNAHAGSETWIERLREAGYDVDAQPVRAPADLETLGRNMSAAVAIDLARAPSHGRDLGLAVRQETGDGTELEGFARLCFRQAPRVQCWSWGGHHGGSGPAGLKALATARPAA